ncbi:hypothetical protein HT031_006830 [Scenedesmus sp. PABB004]|nr:hypothetical protein HT031_006830 [Scenedesmus sp. PABB004]
MVRRAPGGDSSESESSESSAVRSPFEAGSDDPEVLSAPRGAALRGGRRPPQRSVTWATPGDWRRDGSGSGARRRLTSASSSAARTPSSRAATPEPDDLQRAWAAAPGEASPGAAREAAAAAYAEAVAAYAASRQQRALRQRLAQARAGAQKRAAALLDAKRGGAPHDPQRSRELPTAGGAAQPSLPALSVVVRALLQLAAEHGSPAVAAQLRDQLLVQVKAATAAARGAGQPASVAAALHGALPALRAAVRGVCGEAQLELTAAAAAAPPPAPAPPSAPAIRDAAAAVEAALSTAACEVQLGGLALAEARSGGSMELGEADMEALLAAEMASAMAAEL